MREAFFPGEMLLTFVMDEGSSARKSVSTFEEHSGIAEGKQCQLRLSGLVCAVGVYVLDSFHGECSRLGEIGKS